MNINLAQRRQENAARMMSVIRSGKLNPFDGDSVPHNVLKVKMIKAAKAARDRWLQIEVGKGRHTPNGRQNLYHGIVPPNLVAELRTRKAKGLTTPTDEKLIAVANGVAEVHGMHRGGVNEVNGVHL